MNSIVKLAVVAVFAMAGAACSGNHGSQAPASAASASPPASAPPPSLQPPVQAIPMSPPASAGSAGLPEVAPPAGNGPTLDRLMQRPAFAQAFKAMDGASQLPAWVQQGGVATPSQKVSVDGKTMWLAHACESSQCDTGELWLLIDSESRTMQGLFQEQIGKRGASIGKLVWLGKPDATVQAFLKKHLAAN